MKAFLVSLFYLLAYTSGQDITLPVNSSIVLYSAVCNEHSGSIGCSEDCRGLKYCINNLEETVDCRAHTGLPYCDPKTASCVPTPTVCNTHNQSFNFVCPGVGKYIDPLECSNFYICTYNEVYLASCDGQTYDPVNGVCSTRTPCYTFSNLGLCKFRTGAFVTHPLDKSIYVLCKSKGPVMSVCTKPLIFDLKKMRCDFQCKIRGHFPDPNNNKCYYSCDGLITLTSKHACCQNDWEFDPTIKACVPLETINEY